MSIRLSAAAAIMVSAFFVSNSAVRAQRLAARPDEVIRGRHAAAGEVLIRFRQAVQSTLLGGDIDRDERIGPGRWRLIHSRGQSAEALAAAMRARPDVLDAEPNYRVSIDGAPNDLAAPLWGLQNTGQPLPDGNRGTPGADIGAVRAWDTATGSRSIVVATVDTGIMAAHADLAANVWSAPRAFSVTIGGVTISCGAGTHGFNAITKVCDPADDHGHGTHVAGSIGAVGGNALGVVGVNWTASIMALKFLDASGNGYVSGAIDAIEFAIQVKRAFAATGGANIRVLNNSWSGGDYSQALADEIQRANDADMLFVSATGNTSTDLGVTTVYPASYPGANVVAVGATDYNDQLGPYSGRGRNNVHIAAPGTAIYSTTISSWDPNASAYGTMTGTSMSSAYVSGAAALVLSHCQYSTGALRNALLTSAASLPWIADRIQSGRRLDAGTAVQSCPATPPPAADIVLYASDVAASNRRGAWQVLTDATAAGGSALANADAGTSTPNAPSPVAADSFDATFQAPGGVPYHVWVRMRAAGNSTANDSVWLQFSDALVNFPGGTAAAYGINSNAGLAITLENCAGCGVAGWGWQDGSYWLPRGDITFASSGSHTVRVQPREDGVQIDQIVLSPSTYRTSSPGQPMNDATVLPKSPAVGGGPGSSTSTPYGGTAAAIPGVVRLENFDDGGEGVAYHDASSGNAGGAYRATDVDLAADGSGGYVVGWVGAGEWLKYTVNVAAAGTYTAAFQVAALGAGGTFHLEMNGTNVSGALRVPDTGGWLAWQTVSAPVTLTAGTQVARLVMDTNGVNAVGNFKTLTFTAAASSPGGGLRPYGGAPAAVPGRVQAAEFDEGGEGVAYHDESAGNSGGAFRATDVDLAASSEGGYTIGWIGAGEWVNYTVNVAHAGAYTVQLRVAAPSAGGQLHIGFNGSAGSWTAVAIPATGGWQTWTTVNVPLTLNAGTQQITLLFDTGGYNVSWIDVR